MAYVGHSHKIVLILTIHCVISLVLLARQLSIGRLTSIAYETKRCGCDCKVRAYPLSSSSVLLDNLKFLNTFRTRYRLRVSSFLVVTGSHDTRWEA
jgi:hypothetical protein